MFFSRRVYMLFKQTQIFQKGLSNRRVFSRRVYHLFVKQTLFSHRTYTNYSQKTLIQSPSTYYFPGDPYASNRYYFPENPRLFAALPKLWVSTQIMIFIVLRIRLRRPICIEQKGISRKVPRRTDILLI